MHLAALALIAVGVVLTAGGAFAPESFDFAVSVAKGWHVTVFPSPLFGLLLIVTGVGSLLASVVWR